MTHMHRANRLPLAAALIVAAVLTVGCSLTKAKKSYEEGRYEEAAQTYKEVLAKDPVNVKAKIGYRKAATRAAEEHVQRAKEFQRRGDQTRTMEAVQRALLFDPTNGLALDMLSAATEAKEAESRKEEEDLVAMREEAENRPLFELNPRSMDGINLNFSKKTSLKEIFAHLQQASGVSINLHKTYQDAAVQVDLRGLTFQRILDTLMLQSDLFYRVQGPNHIMVFARNPTTIQQYEPQLQKTFFLSNAEITEVKTTLQSLLTDAKIFQDKRMNALIVKARPSDLIMAQRIVKTLDKAKAEVMIYVELLEVTDNSLEQVGLLPVISGTQGLGGGDGIYRLGATLDSSMGMNQNKGAIRITKSDVRFLFPSLALDAMKNSGDAKLVASPNVRVQSGETGKVMIGSEVSTTQSSMGGLGTGSLPGGTTLPGGVGGLGGYVPQTQYGYQPIGVKIDIEPRVAHNQDIQLKLKSSITTEIAGSVPGRPDIGKREIETVARLKDGEVAVFGGLLKEDERKSLQGIWGLSDVPVVGKLFGNSFKKKAKTDVIMTVRAVVVRRPELTKEDFEVFDPEQARSDAGPFAPKKVTPKPVKAALAVATPPEVKAIAQEAPKAPAVPKPTEKPAETPKPEEAPKVQPKAEEKAEPDAKGEAEAPKPSDLVLFCSPISTSARKGDKVQIAVLVSGGKDISGGTFDLKLDGRLKLASLQAGDYLTSEGGSIEHTVSPDGVVKVTFKRATTAGDSGTLGILEMEVVGGAGNAPVLFLNGRYMIGKNPISAKVVNALITVEP